MKDEAYIRKAVELAKAWAIHADDTLATVPEIGRVGSYCLFRPFFLDALAAQLVRQVNAFPQFSVEEKRGLAQVVAWDLQNTEGCGTVSGIPRAICEGSDQSMIKIKAIIDSGVLENE